MILKCACQHNYQDAQYGDWMRVCNQTTKQGGNVYRCTACTDEQTIKSKKKEPEDEKKK